MAPICHLSMSICELRPDFPRTNSAPSDQPLAIQSFIGGTVSVLKISFCERISCNILRFWYVQQNEIFGSFQRIESWLKMGSVGGCSPDDNDKSLSNPDPPEARRPPHRPTPPARNFLREPFYARNVESHLQWWDIITWILFKRKTII